MEFLKSLLTNAWVVSIFSGVLSTILTKIILSKGDKVEYTRRVNEANMVLIEMLKPYIAEKGLPSKSSMYSLIKSVGRKYNVKIENMYSVNIVCEELIREVIEDIYVPIDKKYEYVECLQKYIDEFESNSNAKIEAISLLIDDTRTNRIRLLSILNGAIIVLISLGTLLTKDMYLKFTNNITKVDILGVSTSIIAMCIVLYSVYRNNK